MNQLLKIQLLGFITNKRGMRTLFYVSYEKLTEEKALVKGYSNLEYVEKPLYPGFNIDEIPVGPIPPRGKTVQTFVNPTTKEFFYEYFDRPLTSDEELQQLKQQNSELMFAIAELASANEKDKIETQLAIAELATTLTGGNQ